MHVGHLINDRSAIIKLWIWMMQVSSAGPIMEWSAITKPHNVIAAKRYDHTTSSAWGKARAVRHNPLSCHAIDSLDILCLVHFLDDVLVAI
jgi:hypothetical protein